MSARRQRSVQRSRWPVPKDGDVTALRDIGAVSAKWLSAVGIHTIAELRGVGPAEAYGRVTYRFGRAANRNLLYAMAMGLQGRAYNDASEAEKRRLCDEVGIPFEPRRRRRRALRVGN